MFTKVDQGSTFRSFHVPYLYAKIVNEIISGSKILEFGIFVLILPKLSIG